VCVRTARAASKASQLRPIHCKNSYLPAYRSCTEYVLIARRFEVLGSVNFERRMLEVTAKRELTDLNSSFALVCRQCHC